MAFPGYRALYIFVPAIKNIHSKNLFKKRKNEKDSIRCRCRIFTRLLR